MGGKPGGRTKKKIPEKVKYDANLPTAISVARASIQGLEEESTQIEADTGAIVVLIVQKIQLENLHKMRLRIEEMIPQRAIPSLKAVFGGKLKVGEDFTACVTEVSSKCGQYTARKTRAKA